MTTLEQYTKTDKSKHEQAKRIIAETLINEAQDRDDAISSEDLADRTPVSASTIRDLIKEVRRERCLPIGHSNGYFIIQDNEEAARQIERQKRQAQTSMQTGRDIARAWNTNKYGGA